MKKIRIVWQSLTSALETWSKKYKNCNLKEAGSPKEIWPLPQTWSIKNFVQLAII